MALFKKPSTEKPTDQQPYLHAHSDHQKSIKRAYRIA